VREERKLRVFENMALRRIFGPRGDEVTGEWRRLHNEELNDLYSSPNIVRVIKPRRMRWAGHVADMGDERGCIGSCWGNRREGGHWGDLGVDGWIIQGDSNMTGTDAARFTHKSVPVILEPPCIRTDLQEVGCGYMDWIGLAKDRDTWRTLVSVVMNLRVP